MSKLHKKISLRKFEKIIPNTVISFMLWLTAPCLHSQTLVSPKTFPEKSFNNAPTLKLLQGNWRHEQDSTSTLHISGKTWLFTYNFKNSPALSKPYKIHVMDSVTVHKDIRIIADYMILTSKQDTLSYEIMGLSDSTLSLKHCPSGKLHLYYKKLK